MVKPEEVVADVEMANVEVAKKKKKKSKKEVTPEVTVEAGKKRAASSDEAEDAPKKKKKKTKSADVEVAEEAVPAVTEEAVSEKAEKKKKKKKSEEEESSPAPTASTKEDSEEEEKAVEAPAAVVEEEKSEESKTVFVGGLPWTATEEQVKKDFEDCGEVVEFRFPLDRDTQQPKGIAFIVYATAEGVKKALEFNETEYGGRTIYVRVDEGSKGGKKGKDGKGKGKGKDGKGKGKKGEMMQPGEKPEGCMSIIVKNCSWETTEESLRATFEPCGEVRRINMMMNDEGTFRGMCFIDYETTEATDEAIKFCNTDLDGRLIFVDFAGNKPAKGKDGKGKGKDGKGKGKGKGKDGKGKGKGKGKKGSDPTYAARNGSIQESSGTAASFDSDSD